MIKLSAFLIVKNESHDIQDCLNSLQGLVDEIIVVDDYSTDDTVAQCQHAGAKVTQKKMTSFGEQKQYALDQTGGEWVLSIDADERVTPQLAQEIKAVLGNPEALDGYEISRSMFFLGHRLRHGGVGQDWVLRLFRRAKGHFRQVSVHEGIEIAERVGRLSQPLLHYSYRTLDEYVEKCNVYTGLAAEERYQQGKRFSSIHHLRPFWELFSRIILRGAWLDGQPGLIYAALSSHAAWLRVIKLWEKKS